MRTRFILQRLGMAVLLLLTVSAVAFVALNAIGDPLRNLLGLAAVDTSNPASVQLIEEAKAQYHLDAPLVQRYFLWLWDFVRGDFGVQFSTDGQPPVRNLIAERAPRTISLLVLAQFLAVIIAIPWGVLGAATEDSIFDRLGTAGTFVLIAIPSFAMGVLLKWLLGIKFGIFPLSYQADEGVLTHLWQLFLPALTLALPVAAVYQRLLRTDMITTLQEDYILVARAKGVSRRAVLFRHALRPSLFSFITVFGINTGALIGGALIVEQIFRVPGLGSAVVEAVLRDDFPVVLAIVMLTSIAFVLINLVVDMLYTIIDPRVRAE